MSVQRDDRTWNIGTAETIEWIRSATQIGQTITSLVPPVFAAYVTVQLPNSDEDFEAQSEESDWSQYVTKWDRSIQLRHELALIDVLTQHSGGQPWWLGYLDTGASDVVFADAPRTTVYPFGWNYVMVNAGPSEAIRWRAKGWNTAIPELMFPADRSWLLSGDWDQPDTSLGGSAQLISAVLNHPVLGPRARQVSANEPLRLPDQTES